MKSDPNKARETLTVAVLGATGVDGVELLRILARHPRVKLTAVTSQQYAGKPVRFVAISLDDAYKIEDDNDLLLLC